MKWSILALFLLAPAPAFAQDATEEPESSRTKFYDFDDLDLHGDTVRPKVLYTDAKERASFARLFKLKRSFLPELRRSADGTKVVAPRGEP